LRLSIESEVVVAGVAQHRVHLVAQRTFKPVPFECVRVRARLLVANGWLHCTAQSELCRSDWIVGTATALG